MFYLLFLQIFFLTCIAQENSFADNNRAARPTVTNPSSCGGCADNLFCEDVAYELAIIESQLAQLIECSCCEHIITQADIDTGTYTITEPGVYCLETSVTFFGPGNAITINNTEPEVLLDLKGNTITGDGSGVAIYVTNTQYSTTIQNGAISNCATGINIFDATQVLVDNLEISLCGYGVQATSSTGNSGGIDVYNSFIRDIENDGLFFQNVNFCRVVNSSFATIGQTGVHIDGCFVHLVDNVRVIGGLGYAYWVTGSVNSSFSITYKNSTADGNNNSGFVVEMDTTNGAGVVSYTNCKSFLNNGNGFDLIAGSGTQISSVEYIGCEAKGNQGNGFSSNAGGISSNIRSVLYDSCIAHFNSGNPFLSANGDGFYIDGTSFLIKSCNAELNNGSGIHLSPNSVNCEVVQNSLANNNNFGIEDQGIANLIYSNVASGNSANYSPSVPLQLLPTDITGYWINVDPTSVTIGEYESKINELLNLEQSCCNAMGSAFDVVTSEIESISLFDQSCCASTISAFDVVTSDVNVANSQLEALSGFSVSCCDATTSSFNVVTSEIESVSVFDQSCCSSTMSAFDVITSSIDALDACAPIFITSLPYPINGPGVYVLCSDLTSAGGVAITITNYVLGQTVLDLNGHAIVGSGSDWGIQIFGNSGSVVVQNGSVQNFGTGIEVYGANVSIKDVDLLAMQTKGIYVEGSDNVNLENISVKIFSDAGIEFYSSTNINAKSCEIFTSGVGSIGLFCNGVAYGTFDDIEVSLATKFGICVVDGPSEIRDVTFNNCFVTSSYIGVWIEQQNDGRMIGGLSFFDTVVTGSYNTGIAVRGVDYGSFYPILFKNNTIERSEGTAVELFFGTSHILDNCTISFNNGIGVFMDRSDRCQVINSTINNNGSDGISNNSSNFFIHNSIANNNRGRGLYVWNNAGIINTQITQCLFNNNDDVGVYIEGSDRAVIEGCTVTGNRHGIILESPSSNAQVLHNYVANNPGNGIFNNSGSGYVWGNYSYANGSNYAGTITFVPVLGAGYWDNVY